MRLFPALIILAASPALADPQLVTDAFGVAATDDIARAGWSGYRETLSGVGEIIAPEDGASVQFYLGEKSLVAGVGRGLAMALVMDAKGNLVADGTGATFTLDSVIYPAITHNGIAAATFGPFQAAGQFHAGAAIAGQQSARAEYVVTADLASVKPVLAETAGPMLPEDFHEFATSPLADRFGNAVSDGSGLTVELRGDDGRTTILPAITVGGVARAILLARDLGPKGTVRATLAANESVGQPFRIASLLPAADLAVTAMALPDIAATSLKLGPFLTDAGHLLNDGALITVAITTVSGATQVQSGWVLDGSASFLLLLDRPDFPLSLTISSPLGTVSRNIPQLEVGQ